MRFMVIVKATPESEAGMLPSPQLLQEMGKFNRELIDAGVLLAADGLQSSSKGARVTFSGTDRIVTKGPFPETKDLVSGYWIWKLNSLDEAIEWLKRCPNTNPNPASTQSAVEIRQMFEPADFS